MASVDLIQFLYGRLQTSRTPFFYCRHHGRTTGTTFLIDHFWVIDQFLHGRPSKCLLTSVSVVMDVHSMYLLIFIKRSLVMISLDVYQYFMDVHQCTC